VTERYQSIRRPSGRFRESCSPLALPLLVFFCWFTGKPYLTHIGLIQLPDGRRSAIAVFVTDSTADEATRERVIACIARVVYDASLQKTSPAAGKLH
jgi:hypothetical protein